MTRPEEPTVFFVDNVRLAPWDIRSPEAVEAILLRPASNGAYYHSNPESDVAVRVTLRPPREQWRDLAVCLSLHRSDGKEIGKGVRRACTRRLEVVTVPKPAMCDGERIEARFALRRGDETLRSCRFTIVRRPPAKDEVVLRDDGVTLVNGKPFFPFGMYQSPVSEFPTLARMGFNTVHTYVPADAAYMEAAEKAGLRVISAVKGTYSEPPHYHEVKWRDSDVADYVRSIMRSPALLAYYLFDEPSPGLTPPARLRALCDIPRRIDPYHLAAGCNNNYQYAYRRVADAMMVDAYPVPGKMNHLIAKTREGAKAQEPNLALWFIPQAFSWEPYFRVWSDAAGKVARRPGRTPTFDEVRTMPWLAVAIGARGLIYYSWQTQGFYVRDAYPVFWRAFEHHATELAAVFPWLLEREPARPVSSSDSAVFVAARRRGKDLFVAAANSALKPTRAVLTVPGLDGRKLHVISEDREVLPEGDALDVAFAAMETHIFTTSLAGLRELPTLVDIRSEQTRLAKQFAKENPSISTVRDGAELDASWGFPGPPEVKWASWRRMIDGRPGTPWLVGEAFRAHEITGWKDKDFDSPGRWIEVRLPKPKRINMLRAIVSPWADVELRLFDAGQWRTVQTDRVVDEPKRRHHRPSATTTARFEPTTTDRFRAVFTKRRQGGEAVFELSAALVGKRD